jgi:ABC-type multidrug transport system ATPase subunit
MITTRGLTKAYGTRQVLDRLDLDVRGGEITLLVGANGCGKSTTLRLIAGLSSSDAGSITIDGHPFARERTQALAALSYLPQSPRFHSHLTVGQIVEFYASLRAVPMARALDAVDHWGLSGYRMVRCGRLSGGLRQRLALAILFMSDAPVLLLDEPGLSLDPDWRRFLQGELRSAVRRGRTAFVSTHLLGEWDEHGDRCLVLEAGRVSRELPADRLREAFPFALHRHARGLASSAAPDATAEGRSA